MSTILATLLAELQKRMDEEYSLVSGTVDSGTTTTVVDAVRDEDDDYWINHWIYIDDTTDDLAPEGEEHKIVDFANSTGTMTVSPAFTAAPDAGDTYQIRRVRPRWQYLAAINYAIRQARHAWFDYTEDKTTIIICDDQLEYSLPTDIQSLLRVDLERTDTHVNSTATGSTSTTLVDSTKSWTTNEWATDYAVAIYDGTGKCQQRTITSNDATSLTVPTWTTNPSTDSKYVIKWIGSEEQVWSPITSFDWLLLSTPKIHFYYQFTSGMSARIYYATELDELSATTDSTSCPEEYIMLKAMSYLWETTANRATGSTADYALAQAANYDRRAEDFKLANGYRLDYGRIRDTSLKGFYYPSDYPF